MTWLIDLFLFVCIIIISIDTIIAMIISSSIID